MDKIYSIHGQDEYILLNKIYSIHGQDIFILFDKIYSVNGQDTFPLARQVERHPKLRLGCIHLIGQDIFCLLIRYIHLIGQDIFILLNKIYSSY